MTLVWHLGTDKPCFHTYTKFHATWAKPLAGRLLTKWRSFFCCQFLLLEVKNICKHFQFDKKHWTWYAITCPSELLTIIENIKTTYDTPQRLTSTSCRTKTCQFFLGTKFYWLYRVFDNSNEKTREKGIGALKRLKTGNEAGLKSASTKYMHAFGWHTVCSEMKKVSVDETFVFRYDMMKKVKSWLM